MACPQHRYAINELWQSWLITAEKEQRLMRRLQQELTSIAVTKAVMALPGLGPITTAGLLCALGDGSAFSSGKQAGAFIGTAPKQHSTAGKVTMIGVAKKSGHTILRSNLVQGAWAILLSVKKRGPVCDTERWLLALSERRGERCAVMALANKNVRQAWAIIARHYEDN